MQQFIEQTVPDEWRTRVAKLLWMMGGIFLFYLWLIAVARRVELAKVVDLIDRHDRRELSLFRLGRDFVDHCLALADPIPSISHLPFF